MKIHTWAYSKFCLRFTIILLGSLPFLSSCGPNLPEEVALAYDNLPNTIDFNYHVRPILSDRCWSCHGPDNNNRGADLRLDVLEGAYADLKESEGKAIVVGNADKSVMIQRMIAHDKSLVMPPPKSNLTLTPDEIATVAKWIEQGAEWKEHWSFIPPEKPEIPDAVFDSFPVYNEIDLFVHEALKREDMKPSPQADKERLLRRVTLDLTGLPPSIPEIDAFLADSSPDAYEKVVDRLLQSDAHAERMAMEWLDVARYADSHGMHADGYREMWRWRDWAIQAFKQNMPYDQFVTWQLAGDMLPDATQESKLATGFLRNHRNTSEGGAVDEEAKFGYILDRVNTTATAFLGLTMECAQCHDHKFDPISQKNYFQMAAFFNNMKELGMGSNDGNYGPLLAVPSDGQAQQLDSLNHALDALKQQIAMEEVQTEKLKAFAQSLPADQAIELPTASAYYPFEQKGSIRNDKGKKQTILDGNRDTQINGVPTFQEGVKGKALHFDDSYENIALGKQGLFDIADAFTTIAWVKPDVDQKIQTILGNAGHKNNFWRGWDLFLDSSNHLSARLIHKLPDEYIEVKSVAKIPLDEWTQVGFSYDGLAKAKGLSLFINGKRAASKVLQDKLSQTIYPTEYFSYGEVERPIRIARSYRIHTGEFGIYKGAIDEVRVFAQQLSQAEVQRYYQYTLGETPSSWASLPEQLKGEHARLRKDVAFQQKRAHYQQLLAAKMQVLKDVPNVMVMEEMDKPQPMFVYDRGLYDAPTEEVQPNTPESVLAFPSDLPRNRLGLAKWLFREDNPLTARVAVNRYWQMLFGKGFVTTTHDFGSQGSLPTHPALLDFLAVALHDSGWDVRALLKKIVLSATYRQRSLTTKEQFSNDRDNLLLARGPSQRLQAEMIRDYALAASGLLVGKVGGPSVKPYQPSGLWREKSNFSRMLLDYHPNSGDSLYRRSMYTFIRRTSPPPMMTTFDAPNRQVCTVKRESTNTPLQSLVLMNDPQFVEAARVMAERVQKEGGEGVEAKMEYGFRLATGRMPQSKELAVLTALFEQSIQRFKAAPLQADALLSVGEYPLDTQLNNVETAAWATVTHTLLNHDEFYMKR